MPRKARLDFPDKFYHICCRGQRKEKLFFQKKDYLVFLKKLKKVSVECDTLLYGYCLMPNHYHLLVKRREDLLSKFMSKLNTSFALYFNRKYSKVGYVFQGRYNSWIILNDRYLLNVLHYIHLNPGDDPNTGQYKKYKYSSDGFYRTLKSDMIIFRIPHFQSEDGIFKYNKFMNDPYSEIPYYEDSIGSEEEYLAIEKRTNKICKANFHERRKNQSKDILIDANIILERFKLNLLLFNRIGKNRSYFEIRNYLVIELFKKGYLQSSIGKLLGVSHTTIYKIINLFHDF
ncbi:MAG: transposase [bacterium]|nr:transposase [bacterium]